MSKSTFKYNIRNIKNGSFNQNKPTKSNTESTGKYQARFLGTTDIQDKTDTNIINNTNEINSNPLVKSEDISPIILIKSINNDKLSKCVLCDEYHKFSPFNVTINICPILPAIIPMMIVDKKSESFNVSIIRNYENKELDRLTIGNIRHILSNNLPITNHAIYWSDGLEILGENGLMLLLIQRPNMVNSTTIENILKMINCPKWWDIFLSNVSSAQIDNDSIANSIERSSTYRDKVFECANLSDKYIVIRDYSFPILTKTLRSLRERQKRINEEKQQRMSEDKKKKKIDEEQNKLIKSLIAIQEREQKELENTDESDVNIISFEEEFINKLTTIKKGNCCKFIAAINPDTNVFANIVQKAGESSKLQSGVDNEDKIKKVIVWEYFLIQEADLKNVTGKKYKDYNKGQKKSDSIILNIPTIPKNHPDYNKSDDDPRKPKPLLTLNSIQKKQYSKIWSNYHNEILSSKNVTNKSEFILDDWQNDSITYIRTNKSCLITGPTSGGKTYVMMKGMDNIINGLSEQIVIYVSPTFHLAYQTYANVKATFPKRMVSIITAELISIPSDSNIIIGTAPQLLNYFVTTKKTFQVGIFDEIHVASNAYYDSSSKSDIIRAKAYSRLISRCENQIIAASATIEGIDEMRKFIAHQMNYLRKDDKPHINYTDINHVNYTIRAVPLSEYRFIDNSIIQPLIRDSISGIDKSDKTNSNNHYIESEITPENLFKLLNQMKNKEMTPTIVFDSTDDIAWKTYVDLINFVEKQETLDYISYTQLIEKTNNTIDKFNTDRNTRMTSLPESDNTDNSKLCDGKKGNSRREAGLRVIRNNRMKTFESMITDAKTIFIRSIDRYNNENIISHCNIPYELLNKEVIIKIARIFGIRYDELINTYPNIHISNSHIDIMKIIKYLEDVDSDQTENIININTDKGSYFRFANSCGMDQLKAIREPGSDEECWKQRKIMITLAEAQHINPKDIDGIIDVVMRGLEFGIAIINPSLPFVIQNIILENLRTKNMGVVIASESMSMGINYPLRSVVIKSHYGSISMNAGKMIQMAGRCGRRGKDNQAHVIYWGISNAEEAHPSCIKPLTDYKINFYISDGDETAGSMINDQLDLAINLGLLFDTYYFYEEKKKKILPMSSTKNGGRIKQSRHESSNIESKSNIESDDFENRERKICEARTGNVKLSRSQYIIPTIEKLAIRIGYTDEQSKTIADMIAKIDNDIITESYAINSFQKSRDINLIMHMLIELHNTYAMSSNTEFLNFLEEMTNILQTCEYRLIKLAN
jgi:hypothetical protein